MAWVATVSGARIDYPDTDPEQIRIEDIAHALSRMPRWAGHTTFPVSVAQHCLNCSAVAEPKDQLAALLHDASEAYIADLPKPFKMVLPEYKDLEGAIIIALEKRFGLTIMTEGVHEVDARMLKTEHVLFCPQAHIDAAKEDPYLAGLVPYEREALTLPGETGWRLARALYLERFREKTGEDFDMGLLPQ
jgi:hypothetical protein